MRYDLKLRTLQLKDAPFILEWMKNRDINRYFRFDPAEATNENVEKFFMKKGKKYE